MEKRKWLIEKRENLKLTQEQVAVKSGISRPLYTFIENGERTPSVKSAMKIANALGFEWSIFFNQKSYITKQL